MKTPKDTLIDFLKAKHIESGGNCGTITPKIAISTKIDRKELKVLLKDLCDKGFITYNQGGQGDLVKWKSMTTEKNIQERKTTTLKKGDKVVMHTCMEANFYKDRVWTCKTDSYKKESGTEVVFLEGFRGCFSVDFLKKAINK